MLEQRPWGFFNVLGDSKRFKVKTLMVKPHSRLSLQSHEHRHEHWFVVEGIADVEVGTTKARLFVGQSINVAIGEKHRISNTTDNWLYIVEVQTGESFDESDITRYQDDYDRVADNMRKV